jgi:hypothetical protein
VAIEKLYLHIGRGKTGTTAIQHFLSNHREILRASGLHYVEAGDEGKIGHQDFAKSFIVDPPPYMHMPARPENAREAVRAELARSGLPNALLSSENFTLAEVSEVARFFAQSLGIAEIKIIFFVRSQDELAESQYNQMVKLALCHKTFDQFVVTELDELDFSAVLAPWAAQFGKSNIIVRVFDAKRNDAVADFLSCLPLHALDLNLKEVQDAVSINASVGFLALEIFRALNRFEFPQQRALYRRLHDAVEPNDLPPVFFSSEQARAFRDRFRASNGFLIHEYLGGQGDDLGGRRYSDAERDRIFARIQQLRKTH